MSDIANDEDCSTAIARIGALDRDLARIDAGKAAAVARASADAEERATPLLKERAELEAAVAEFCQENRERLTDGFRTKTATLTTGEVSWRLGKSRVVVDESLKDKIIATLKKRGLPHMIRVKEELDKTAIGKQPDKIKGIAGLKIEVGEEQVVVKPIGAELVQRAPEAAAA